MILMGDWLFFPDFTFSKTFLILKCVGNKIIKPHNFRRFLLKGILIPEVLIHSGLFSSSGISVELDTWLKRVWRKKHDTDWQVANFLVLVTVILHYHLGSVGWKSNSIMSCSTSLLLMLVLLFSGSHKELNWLRELIVLRVWDWNSYLINNDK